MTNLSFFYFGILQLLFNIPNALSIRIIHFIRILHKWIYFFRKITLLSNTPLHAYRNSFLDTVGSWISVSRFIDNRVSIYSKKFRQNLQTLQIYSIWAKLLTVLQYIPIFCLSENIFISCSIILTHITLPLPES